MSGIVLVFSVILGGGAAQGLFSDSVLQLASLPLLGLGVVCLFARPIATSARFPLLLAVGFLLLVALQLVPLPPSIWTRLPGRAQFAATYVVSGIPLPWLPLSLHPAATWLSGLSLVPPLAIFLAMFQLSVKARRQLCWILGTLALFSAFLGFAQLLDGPESGLRPFGDRGNTEVAVGFFANRNQYAALLYTVMPLIAALATLLSFEQRRKKSLGASIGVFVYVALMLGLITTVSRAGIILGLAAGAGSLAIITRSGLVSTISRSTKTLSLIGLAIVVIAHLGLLAALEHRPGLEDEGRLQIYRVTARAIADFLPAGSGLGTFVPVYAMYEEPADVSNVYTNRAHNDWLEALLEGGLPALGLVTCFLAWFAMRVRHVWLEPGQEARSSVDPLLARGASIAILLLLLHSAVDYPLRTAAVSSIFAFACAMLTPAPIARGAHAGPAAPRRDDRRFSQPAMRFARLFR